MLSAQVWMRACRSLELSPQAPATKQRSSPKPCSLATKAPVSPGGVPLTSLSSVRCRGKFSCSPDCLFLCFACRISRDPGGHCFDFAKTVCDTIRCWKSEEQVRCEADTLTSMMKLASFRKQVRRQEVPEPAKDFCFSPDLAVVADVDDAELDVVVPPPPGVSR